MNRESKPSPCPAYPPSNCSALPAWLREDASFLVCSKCGRKSYAATVINAPCEMPQPSGKTCDGIMQGPNTKAEGSRNE